MRTTAIHVGIAVVMTAASATGACERLGFSNRVLLHLPSPDGQVVFVCQEIPEFDGPGHDWRLEKPNGTVLRQLLRGGDGNGRCREAIWSPDGTTLAIVWLNHVHVADVGWTLSHPEIRKTHCFVREFSFHGQPAGERFRHVQHLRFVAPGELAFDVCDYSLESVRQSGVPVCDSAPTPTTLKIPSPLVPGRAS